MLVQKRLPLRRFLKLPVQILLLALTLTGTACFDRVFQSGPLKHDSVSIGAAVGDVDSLRLEINTRTCVTRLDLGVGSGSLVEGSFNYNFPEWKPDVSYTNRVKMEVLIESPSCVGMVDDTSPQNDWSLLVNGAVPLTLIVDHDMSYYAVGPTDFDLRGLSLRELEMRLGDDKGYQVDLSGAWVQGFNGRIESVEGAVTLLLPDMVGVFVEVDGLTANQIDAGVFTAEGDGYKNAAYDMAAVSIHLTLSSEKGIFILQEIEE